MLTVYINRLGDIFLIFRFFYFISFGWFYLDTFFIFSSFLFSIFLTIACITKRAQIPFSSWLPAAMSAPTPVSSLVHSSTLVTAGVYLIIRFYYLIRALYISYFFILIRLTTSFSAGIIASIESDLKKLVAISTLRQLGIIIFTISIGQFYLTFFHMLSHALFKSLIFLSCGYFILLRLGNQDIRYIGNKYAYRGNLILMVFLASLRLCGFPFLSGFFSKDLIIDFGFLHIFGVFFLILFLLSCFLSIIYRFKLVFLRLINYLLGFSCSYFFYRFLKNIFLLLLCFWSIFLGNIFSNISFDGEFYRGVFLNKVIGLNLFLLLIFVFFLNFFYYFSFISFFVSFFFRIINLNWYVGGGFNRILSYLDFLMVGELF